jgi:hypothetical protein
MLTTSNEKLLSKVIAFGAAFTTIFLISGSVTDPVNVPKFVSLGVVSLAAIGIVFSSSLLQFLKAYKVIWVLGVLFIMFGLVSLFNTESPLTQALYGSYGRNNGLLTYVFLVFILLAVSALSRRESFTRLLNALFVAGIINVVYCLWAIAFGDFIGWNNPYGEILGTFGNPNFIGAFLGMFFAAYFGYAISAESKKYFRYSAVVVLPVVAFEIVESHAIQGRVVGAAGIAIVGFFYLRSKFKPLVTSIYALSCSIAGAFALLGALQIGPLTSLIYKPSVSFRGQYWLAGWNTGQTHPFTGAGMDAFGDWYRRSRDIQALERPGVNIATNAVHNVPLDMFAFGGWPLFITYLAIMGFGAWSLFRIIQRTKTYDPILVVLTTTWVGYQLQSIISINQIGLAIWGWILTGAVIAYERTTRVQEEANHAETRRRARQANPDVKAGLAAFGTGLLGLILALPPLVSDSNWQSAQESRTVDKVEASMISSYFNPQNSMRYITNIQLLENSNLPDFARKYALEAVEWNPESYDLWKLLYLLRNSTPEDKSKAVDNMRRLDPLNPDVTATR